MARNNLELAAAMGKRMTEKRKECGLTQEVVADLAGITHQQYNRAENGKTCLGSASLLRISDVLHTSTDYLLTGKIVSEKYKDTIDLLEKLPDNQVLLVNKMIQCIADHKEE